MNFVTGYTIVSLLIAAVDLLIAWRVSRIPRRGSRALALTCVVAAAVDVFYLISIRTDSFRIASWSSSLYFIGIDVMLNCLASFAWSSVRGRPSKAVRCAATCSLIYMAWDCLLFLVNPFYEIAFHLTQRDTLLARFPFRFLPLAQAHLIYSYLLVGFVLAALIWKAFSLPREYRLQYTLGAGSIFLIVAVNAVFLFLPDRGLLSLVDVSVLLYSAAAFLLYWCFYGYTHRDMLNQLKGTVFASIDQGIVLFDYEDRMILFNAKAAELLPQVPLAESEPLPDFLQRCGIDLKTKMTAQRTSIQCYLPAETGELQPLRCDYRTLLNSRQETIGKLFVFADVRMQTDLLTGFHNLEDFQKNTASSWQSSSRVSTVGICDITSLALINSVEGSDAGDRAVKNLAELVRSAFQQDAYYIRGQDANMVVLCYDMPEEKVLEQFAQIAGRYERGLVYAVSVVDQAHPDVREAIAEAERALHTRKLMHEKSSHHHVLTSLLKALQECDSDTEQHIRRTRLLAEKLAAKMKLSSVQTGDLMLLALLHDIGKIGVPLDILNKPGNLTPGEWRVIHSHAEKGYQIAMSSPTLAGIAKEIRHHHEHWDGSGYPDGLSRESIPLLSRIIAVVDAYDAMVMNRSYRSGRPAQAALEELRRSAGTLFDPYVVSNLTAMLQENPELAYSAATEDSAKAAQTQQAAADGEAPSRDVSAVSAVRYQLDENMCILTVDDLFTGLTGYTRQEAAGLLQTDLLPEADRTTYLCQLNRLLAKNMPAVFEHRVLCKNGSMVPVFGTVRSYYDSSARSSRYEVILYNSDDTMAVRRQAEQEQNKTRIRMEEWESAYRRDSMTGLLTKAAYTSDVEMLLLKQEKRIMMLMIDLDRFKQYNDTYGHKAGDDLLIFFAHTLSAALRAEDLVCRMGGDEFSAVIRISTLCTPEEAKNRAEGIFNYLSQAIRRGGYDVGLTMGAFLCDDRCESFVELYEAADSTLYRGKLAGRNRMEFDCAVQ